MGKESASPIYQKFNKESYDKYDYYVKEKMAKFLKERGHEVLKDEEDYNHGLVTERGGKVNYFELEAKVNYPFTTMSDYPFDTVSFLGRKKRLHHINPFFYVILCYETGAFVSCHSSDIYKDKYRHTINISTKERKGMDVVYRVPKLKCMFSNIKDNER